MKLAYFDCCSGASGDMILASLIDAGLDVADLYEDLQSLPLEKFNISTHKTRRGSLRALLFDVEFTGEEHPERTLDDVCRIIEESALDPAVKEMCSDIFKRLAEAEGKVHGMEPDAVHFHEIGALDSIVDIVGAVAGLARMDVEDVRYGSLALGEGCVECAHGTFPVPAPATLELVRGRRVMPGETEGEMLTPTGAAILTTIGSQGSPPGDFVLDGIGYGAGTAERAGRPNVLRVLIGSTRVPAGDGGAAIIIETNIDDMSSECYPLVFEKTLEAGALDVYVTPVLMKKGRPGHVLTIVTDENHRAVMEEIIFRHTTTFGIRSFAVERSCLRRFEDVVDTAFGPVKVKKGLFRGRLLRTSPEYEDCRRTADEAGVSVSDVYNAVAAKISDL